MDTWRNNGSFRALILLLMVAVLGGAAPHRRRIHAWIATAALDPPLQVTADQFSQRHSCSKRADLCELSRRRSLQGRHGRHEQGGRFSRQDLSATRFRSFAAIATPIAAFMRKYNPSLRTDQFSQYQTSVHGKLLAKGDTKVAVCIDCHGVHDLRPASDPRSKIRPLNVAQTCARCHSDAEYMHGYGIPTDQYGQLQKERAPRSDGSARGLERPGVPDVSRQPRGHSARNGIGAERMREMPCIPGADV